MKIKVHCVSYDQREWEFNEYDNDCLIFATEEEAYEEYNKRVEYALAQDWEIDEDMATVKEFKKNEWDRLSIWIWDKELDIKVPTIDFLIHHYDKIIENMKNEAI
jgi:hypothetical protein